MRNLIYQYLACYVYKKLGFFIWVQLNNRVPNLNLWKDMVKKVINIAIKINFQPPIGIKKNSFRYLKSYRSAKKNKIIKNNQDYWDWNRDKNKSIQNLVTANTNQF